MSCSQIMFVPLTEVRPGDLWTGSDDDVEITEVEAPHHDDVVGTIMVRYHGRVVRGYGKSKRVYTWCFPADMRIYIERRRQ